MKNVAIAVGLVGLFAAAFAACSQSKPNAMVTYDDDMTNHAPSSSADPGAPTTQPSVPPSNWPVPES